jgi:hypothetical protein
MRPAGSSKAGACGAYHRIVAILINKDYNTVHKGGETIG